MIQIQQILNKSDEEKKHAPQHLTWALMADSGFQGIQHSFRAVLPFKKPQGRELLPNEAAVNQKIARHRVVIENFYGRMVKKFKIMDIKYTYDKENFNLLFKLCVALTNFEISIRPLRNNF